MEIWTESTDVSFIYNEGSAFESSMPATTARPDVLAEHMRGTVVINYRLTFPVPQEEE